MALYEFKYRMNDDYSSYERSESILSQIPDLAKEYDHDEKYEIFIDKVGRPFYEIELTCSIDDETLEVKIVSAK